MCGLSCSPEELRPQRRKRNPFGIGARDGVAEAAGSSSEGSSGRRGGGPEPRARYSPNASWLAGMGCGLHEGRRMLHGEQQQRCPDEHEVDGRRWAAGITSRSHRGTSPRSRSRSISRRALPGTHTPQYRKLRPPLSRHVNVAAPAFCVKPPQVTLTPAPNLISPHLTSPLAFNAGQLIVRPKARSVLLGHSHEAAPRRLLQICHPTTDPSARRVVRLCRPLAVPLAAMAAKPRAARTRCAVGRMACSSKAPSSWPAICF